jgi:DNA uptake protein ComE-like DNA-binding protein
MKRATRIPVSLSRHQRGPRDKVGAASRSRGSVLIIVLWICLGLVALTLYFANSMSSELRAADNRVTEIAARQAIAGGTRYAAYVLTQYATGGAVPNIQDYKAEALAVGDASFWFIGRNNDDQPQQLLNEPYFALVDESSKLNLNTVTSAMLQTLPLPGMTPEFADAIVAWRTATGQNSADADNLYAQLDPPRHNKGAPYETVDELRLINGAMLDIILGEDTNRNGVLDPNEDDGDLSAPHDDQNGVLLAGLLEYVTVYSSQPATAPAGGRRINVTTLNTLQAIQQLGTRLTQRGITQQRVTQILLRIAATQIRNQNQGGNRNPTPTPAPNPNAYTSVADFMLATQMTADEWVLVHADLTAATATTGIVQGLVNVNTASAAVLGAIPGIGPDNAATLIAYRQSHPDEMTSFAWLTQVLPAASVRQAGRYITDQSYQFSADIAAVGNNGRGYCREKVVFDTSSGTPRIVFRQDLTAYGWALGTNVRRNLRGLSSNDT